MQCTTHPETDATGTCTYSGKPFCSDCLIEVENKLIGKPYISQVMTEARETGAKNNPTVFMNAGGGTSAPGIGAIPTIIIIPKSKGVAYGLWCASLVGICGLQRYYIGQPVTGTVYLLTLGLLGFGQLFDLFVLGNRVDVHNALRANRGIVVVN